MRVTIEKNKGQLGDVNDGYLSVLKVKDSFEVCTTKSEEIIKIDTIRTINHFDGNIEICFHKSSVVEEDKKSLKFQLGCREIAHEVFKFLDAEIVNARGVQPARMVKERKEVIDENLIIRSIPSAMRCISSENFLKSYDARELMHGLPASSRTLFIFKGCLEVSIHKYR